MENTNIYAVFLDIDGTLMSGGELAKENVTAIKKARECGHKVFINTGRSYSFIPWSKLGEIEFDGVCAGCGSYVETDGKILRSVAVDPEFVKSTVDFYKRNGRSIFFEGESACFYVNSDKDKSANVMLNAGKYKCYEVTDSSQFEREFKGQRISKFTYWNAGITKEERDFWSKKLRVIEHPTYTESVIYGCDKALAMKIALEYLNIPRERSIAMGDSVNDEEMLRYAGISVAMGNAVDSIKSICSYVSADAKDAGVACALYELLSI